MEQLPGDGPRAGGSRRREGKTEVCRVAVAILRVGEILRVCNSSEDQQGPSKPTATSRVGARLPAAGSGRQGALSDRGTSSRTPLRLP